MIEEYRETLRSYTKRTDSKVTLDKNQGGGMIVRHPDSVKKKNHSPSCDSYRKKRKLACVSPEEKA